MPALERILCRLTQLPKGGFNAFTELYMEFECSNAVFVRVHELPPSSPRIPPHRPDGQFSVGINIMMKIGGNWELIYSEI
jgi:hypothetical protein